MSFLCHFFHIQINLVAFVESLQTEVFTIPFFFVLKDSTKHRGMILNEVVIPNDVFNCVQQNWPGSARQGRARTFYMGGGDKRLCGKTPEWKGITSDQKYIFLKKIINNIVFLIQKYRFCYICNA